MPGKSVLAMLAKPSKTEKADVELGEEEAAASDDAEVADTAGEDAMSSMFAAIDSRDPKAAFDALKDAIAAAGD